MNGLQLDYKSKPGMGTYVTNKMFGRVFRTRSDTPKAYYTPGVLDDVSFAKVCRGRVFISTCGPMPDFDEVMVMCSEFKLSSAVKDLSEDEVKTGREKWMRYAEERGFKVDAF